MKIRKSKDPTAGDFEDACQLWRIEFGCYSFEAVRDGIRSVCARNLESDSPEYYPIIVGLICLYARPFTNNRPVGPLSDEIVPPEEKDVHETIMGIRHKLFAHAEASAVLRDDDYPNDVFLMNYNGKSSLTLARFAPKLEFLKRMSPLVDTLIKETAYCREKLVKKLFNKHIAGLGTGEFRLNALDPTKPIFVKLTEAEKRARDQGLANLHETDGEGECFAN